MKSNLPTPTAKNINDAHQCAKESAENAVEWAVKCGQLLKAKKDEVGHGNWESWVKSNCAFSLRSAVAYMKVAGKQAQIRSALPISSIRQALEEDRPKAKVVTPKGAVSVVKAPRDGATATEETGDDRPAAPDFDSAPAPTATQKQRSQPELPQKTAEITPAPDFDFAGYEPEDDDAYKQNIENVMMADDKLAAMREELKQIHRELQAVKSSRDHYQSEAGAAVRLVKARDREIEKLKRELARLRDRAAA